jgi:hypothetical protein
MQARAQASNEAGCPVSDAIISRLYRADDVDIRAIASELPEATRAELALFCYARAHLRNIGRQIAEACDRETLIRAGNLGLALAQRRIEPAERMRSFSKVTLATREDMKGPPLAPEEWDDSAAPSEDITDSVEPVQDTVR